MKVRLRKFLFFIALLFGLNANAQTFFSPPCFSWNGVTLACLGSGTIQVDITYAQSGSAGSWGGSKYESEQFNRNLYVGIAISNALSNANNSLYYNGAEWLVTFKDGTKERFTFNGNRVSGVATVISGTKVVPTPATTAADGCSVTFDAAPTNNFIGYLNTITYYPSTGQIVSWVSVPLFTADLLGTMVAEPPCI